MSDVHEPDPDECTAGQSDGAGSQARRLSDFELDVFRRVAEKRRLSAGDQLFRRGELGRTMYVIESGCMQLDFGDGLRDKRLGAREFFGELALFIGDHARLASASALSDAEVLVIVHADFDALLDEEPAIMARFMRRSFTYLVASEQRLITHLKRRNEELLLTLDSLRQTRTKLTSAERMVQTDELTSLHNRRGLYAHLEERARWQKPNLGLGLLLIDLDNFKQINDQYGHVAGDRVLELLAAQIKRSMTSLDLACRLGGDEFALLLQVAEPAELAARARSLVEGVRRLVLPEPLAGVSLSISVGGVWCESEASWSIWYSQADDVLYRVKAEGGDHCQIAPPGDMGPRLPST